MDATDDTGAALWAWMERFSAFVRARDFDGARPMIAPEVVSFGTKENIVEGRENLITQQWQHIWPATEGFTFERPTFHWQASGSIAWAVATWTSQGFRPDGTPFPRPGRATLTFTQREGEWLATHTHLSLFPSPAD